MCKLNLLVLFFFTLSPFISILVTPLILMAGKQFPVGRGQMEPEYLFIYNWFLFKK